MDSVEDVRPTSRTRGFVSFGKTSSSHRTSWKWPPGGDTGADGEVGEVVEGGTEVNGCFVWGAFSQEKSQRFTREIQGDILSISKPHSSADRFDSGQLVWRDLEFERP